MPWGSPTAASPGRLHPEDPSGEHPSPHQTRHPPSHQPGYFQPQSGSLALLSAEKPHGQMAGEADGTHPAPSHPRAVVGAADAQCSRTPTRRAKPGTPHPVPARLLPGTPRRAAFWPGQGDAGTPESPQVQAAPGGVWGQGRDTALGSSVGPRSSCQDSGIHPRRQRKSSKRGGTEVSGRSQQLHLQPPRCGREIPPHPSSTAATRPCLAFCMA